MRPSPLIGLVLAAASAPAVFAAPFGPIVKDGVEITILPTSAPAAGPTGIAQVNLDLEARTDDAAHRLGFRSMRGVTEVDCRQSLNRFVKAEAFDQAGLEGPSRPRLVTGNWVRPNPDSYMFAVTQRICASAAPSPSPPPPTRPGPPPIVTAMALPPPAPAQAPRAVQTPAAPAAPTSVPPSPPVHVAMGGAPAPSRPTWPKPPAPTAAVSTRTWSARPDGRGVAQVAAAATAKDAQRVLRALHDLIVPPLTETVEQATVQNASIWRASVVGFASLADAKAFCARAAVVSKTCWVHWKAPAPAKPGRT